MSPKLERYVRNYVLVHQIVLVLVLIVACVKHLASGPPRMDVIFGIFMLGGAVLGLWVCIMSLLNNPVATKLVQHSHAKRGLVMLAIVCLYLDFMALHYVVTHWFTLGDATPTPLPI